MKNNSHAEVWRIGTCKLDLQNGRSLLLYVLNIWHNLVLARGLR